MKHIDIYENFSSYQERKDFTDSEIDYYQKIWDFLPERYRYNKFFLTLWNQAKSRRYLTKKQWIQLEYLFKNGKSQYEAGILPSNY